MIDAERKNKKSYIERDNKVNSRIFNIGNSKTVKLIDKIYASSELNKEININDNNFSKLLGK